MRIAMTVHFDVPDGLPPTELHRLQTGLAQQKGPQEIPLRTGDKERPIVHARVYSVSRPGILP